MFQIQVKGYTLIGDDIDFVTALDDNLDETEDFLNAPRFAITLTDEGLSRHSTAEIYVTKDELDGSTYELILEVIQPT